MHLWMHHTLHIISVNINNLSSVSFKNITFSQEDHLFICPRQSVSDARAELSDEAVCIVPNIYISPSYGT